MIDRIYEAEIGEVLMKELLHWGFPKLFRTGIHEGKGRVQGGQEGNGHQDPVWWHALKNTPVTP